MNTFPEQKEIEEYIETSTSITKIKGSKMQLVPVSMPRKYYEHWNVYLDDFVALVIDGKLVRDTYYRIGGTFKNNGNDFIHIIKHTEDLYDEDLSRETRLHYTKRRHLRSNFCLINVHSGEETKVFDEFEKSYLLENGVYVLGDKYYNTFTNKLICKGLKSISSKDYLFVENAYDSDKSKRGVYKIKKNSGVFEHIK